MFHGDLRAGIVGARRYWHKERLRGYGQVCGKVAPEIHRRRGQGCWITRDKISTRPMGRGKDGARHAGVQAEILRVLAGGLGMVTGTLVLRSMPTGTRERSACSRARSW